jgi:hypothetical protein
MKYLGLSTLLAVTLSLPGCAAVGSGTRDYCMLSSPIYVSKQDVLTFDTEKQILIQNETYARLCGRWL